MVIRVKVIRPIFERDGFSFLACAPENGDNSIPTEYFSKKGDIVVSGHGLPNSQDMSLELTGTWKNDLKHGWSFQTDAYSVVVEMNQAGIITYLKTLDGIGPVSAKKIYDYFGDQTLNIIRSEPERLKNVSGLSQKQFEKIVKAVKEDPEKQKSLSILIAYGLSEAKAQKAIALAGNSAGALVSKNPFFLCSLDRGMFRKAEHISATTHAGERSSERIVDGVLYALHRDTAKGNLFMAYDDITQSAQEVFESPVNRNAIAQAIDLAASEKMISVVSTNSRKIVYPYNLYQSERQVAFSIAELLSYDNAKSNAEIDAALHDAQSGLSFVLDETQLDAAKRTLHHNVSVITGGPGTGKTTLLKVLVAAFKDLYPEIPLLLVAPTGRAARKMSEDSGEPASTIHSCFSIRSKENDGDSENNTEDEDDEFSQSVIQPLQNSSPNIIFIDEVSMLDILVCRHVITSLTPNSRLVFIGDVDQLPSVGPGNVLHDLIESKVVPTSFLKTIHRQAEQSRIILNADRINQGIGDMATDWDFVFRQMNSEQTEDFLVQCYAKALSSGIPLMEIQILSPTKKKKTICSTYSFNTKLQALLNPASPQKAEIEIGDRIFREGDKIIQGKNCKESFSDDYIPRNGDIGQIRRIKDNMIQIDFNGHLIECNRQYIKDQKVDLGYAITIHKSQGSEFQIVLIPMVSEHSFMLRRKTIYTAVTRASVRVIMAGREWVLKSAIKKVDEDKRSTLLSLRLRQYLKKAQQHRKTKTA